MDWTGEVEQEYKDHPSFLIVNIVYCRVDLDIESAGAGSDLQIHLIKSLRESLGHDFHISYTIPALTYPIEPWKTVIIRANQYLNAVNIMSYDYYWAGYNYTMDIQGLMDLGVPKVSIKIVKLAKLSKSLIEKNLTAKIFPVKNRVGTDARSPRRWQ